MFNLQGRRIEEEGIGGIIGGEDNERKREEEESYGEEEDLHCEERRGPFLGMGARWRHQVLVSFG